MSDRFLTSSPVRPSANGSPDGSWPRFVSGSTAIGIGVCWPCSDHHAAPPSTIAPQRTATSSTCDGARRATAGRAASSTAPPGTEIPERNLPSECPRSRTIGGLRPRSVPPAARAGVPPRSARSNPASGRNRAAAEDLVRDQRLFEFLVTSLEMAIDEKRQESRHAGVSREPGARKNVRELGADVGGGRLVGVH